MVISDVLPGDVIYVSDNDGGSGRNYNHLTGRWDVGSLGENESATLHITATVEGGTAEQAITNTAVITESSRPDPEASDDLDEVIITPQGADLEVAKSVNDCTPKEVGTITYTVVVTNHVPAGALDVVISDTLPLT